MRDKTATPGSSRVVKDCDNCTFSGLDAQQAVCRTCIDYTTMDNRVPNWTPQVEGPDLSNYLEDEEEEDGDREERGDILYKALDIINGDRQDSYGDPEDSFKTIANFWSVYLKRYVGPKDVSMMMALLKIAREGNQHKLDNLIDCAGYIGLAADMKGDD